MTDPQRVAAIRERNEQRRNAVQYKSVTDDFDYLLSELDRLAAQVEGMLDGNRPLPFTRDELGRMVREAWVRWALTLPNPKASWLDPYHMLNEIDKEADRQIGEAIARWTLIGDASRSALAASPAALASQAKGRE